MTVQSKPFDSGTNSAYRSVTFTDSDFAQDDILDIQASLGRSGTHIEVDVAADAAVTFRLNAYRVIYGMDLDIARHGIGVPDWTNSAEITDTTINTTTVENGESLVEDRVVKNIQITSLTAGSGVTFRIR